MYLDNSTIRVVYKHTTNTTTHQAQSSNAIKLAANPIRVFKRIQISPEAAWSTAYLQNLLSLIYPSHTHIKGKPKTESIVHTTRLILEPSFQLCSQKVWSRRQGCHGNWQISGVCISASWGISCFLVIPIGGSDSGFISKRSALNRCSAGITMVLWSTSAGWIGNGHSDFFTWILTTPAGRILHTVTGIDLNPSMLKGSSRNCCLDLRYFCQ